MKTMKTTQKRPFASLSLADLRIVKGAATLVAPPPLGIDATRSRYQLGATSNDTRDVD